MNDIIPKSCRIVSDKTENDLREVDFFYPSGSLMVRGLLIFPSNPSAPCPLLVFNHGGINGIYRGLRTISNELASQNGFIVFAPSYRGEDGSDGQIEIARGEVDDVLNGLGSILESGMTDSSRIYMVGSSHGALITLIAMAKDSGSKIKKGVFGYGIADIFRWREYLRNNGMLDDERVSLKSYPFDIHDDDEMRIRNGLGYADKIKTPILIVQGEDDDLVPPEQAFLLKKSLDDAGKFSNLSMIPKAGHGFLTGYMKLRDGTKQRSRACELAWKVILEFFNKNN